MKSFRFGRISTGWIVVMALGACTSDDVGTTGASETGAATTSTTSASTTSPETTGSTTATETTGAATSSTSAATATTGGVCGDGVVDAGEACDDGNLDDNDACTSECAAATCGDGILYIGGEACEGFDLGGESCQSLGFSGGELTCLGDCTHDTSGCTQCGDGQVDDGEACDDGNTDPGDGCDAACQVEACDPDGTYVIDGAAVAYTCCNGLVTVNVSSFLLSADGASIASSPSNPVAMTGAATTCPDGAFMNAGTIPGGCTETYKVAGAFDDQNTWTGTYELEFQGADCTCFNGQLGTPCVGQVFPITAKR